MIGGLFLLLFIIKYLFVKNISFSLQSVAIFLNQTKEKVDYHSTVFWWPLYLSYCVNVFCVTSGLDILLLYLCYQFLTKNFPYITILTFSILSKNCYWNLHYSWYIVKDIKNLRDFTNDSRLLTKFIKYSYQRIRA